MAGDITVGMDFGSYNQMTEKMKRKYKTDSRTDNKTLESEYLFFKHDKKQVVGNAYREALQFNEYGESKLVNAVLFQKGLQYGTSDDTWEKLNKFDYIQGNSQYAIDLNKNGKVDKEEIFDGRINWYSYKKCKQEGSFDNYQK